jgi:GR25 family glycosyltransferase involved in LPS biosynthesis
MSGDRKCYIPPHRRKKHIVVDDVLVGENDPNDDALPRLHDDTAAATLDAAIHRVCCINLESRRDKWDFSQMRALAVSVNFQRKMERFNAINGHHAVDATVLSHDIQREWNSTKDRKYNNKGRQSLPLQDDQRVMSNGEIGCALSHIALWRQLCIDGNDDEKNMLILEDDCSFVRHSGRDRFALAFARAWKIHIFYLGFSGRGERLYVEEEPNSESEQQQGNRQRRDPLDPRIRLYRPEYGYHTHAYMITKAGARRLLENLPVSGPIDVWLADNRWFGLQVYCAVIADEGWRLPGGSFEGKQLVRQVRYRGFKSDVQSSDGG